ncbi:LacI family transcriptional regulator [Litorilinea aerophila]|uniref:LacI family transcriptional regulator n=1 Tax=Litorilinea aerophila TaxID=1204385 RepID=A0A540VC00_9CHLR|nr:LacI family DNA-binding transcriptional regulator [Litorilinea aerophila]MCC9078560.1 LacI family transcriptional regulator [Litorilinea aerophila]
MKRPTQADVARLAGVSRATVSYVLNNQTRGRVPISEETRRRVLDAIAELDYVPDARAQALRSGNTKTIGLIIPDIHNPHFWEMADGAEQAARAAGYDILLSSIRPEDEHAKDIFKNLARRRIDGLIMVPSFLYDSAEAQKTLAALLKRRLPVVGIMSGHGHVPHKIDRILADYRDATLELMARLLAWQHRRIGFVFGIAVPTLGNDRLVAYRESLEAAGLPVDPNLIIQCGPTLEDGYQATRQLLELPTPPTALLAINDLLAIGALRAIADAGLRVPDDISLAGYDDIPLARYLVPRLTTASKDGTKIGQEAIRLLLARLEQPDSPPQEVRVPARLILRESTGPVPIVER